MATLLKLALATRGNLFGVACTSLRVLVSELFRGLGTQVFRDFGSVTGTFDSAHTSMVGRP